MVDESHPRGRKLPYELPAGCHPLFTSNDLPLGHQLAEIAESTRVAEVLKASLELRISQARLDLVRLEREAFYATRHIERCKFPLAPIRRLPVEILSRIFISYADLLRKSPSMHDICNIKTGVWMLGHVCGHWRAVALSTAALWSSFSFRCDLNSDTNRGHSSAAIADEFLLRSSSHLLSIDFDCHNGRSCLAASGGDSCRDVFVTLLARCQQWKQVRLSIPPAFYPEMRIIKDNIPNLSAFKLQLFTLGVERGPVSLHDTDTFRSCPGLTNLKLYFYSTGSYIDFPWHQLTSFSGAASYGTTSVLACAPNIVDCTLRYGEEYPLGQPLVHRMQRLTLSVGRFLPRYLQTLDLPALTHICIEAQTAHGFVNLIRRSRSPLDSIQFHGFREMSEATTTGVLDLLAAAPTVTRLVLIGHSARSEDPEEKTSNVFSALAHSGLTPTSTLPKLEHLTMSGVVFDKHFVHMVESQYVHANGTLGVPIPEVSPLKSLRISDFGRTNEVHLLQLRRIEIQFGLKLTIEPPKPDRRPNHVYRSYIAS
ncbi:hypothetical protein C8F04DRAFT_1392876 [Mycena alexandri]|uniref:F-box domain-containing protein n=1 Tax=Mycena alexandri TaxID=1745969 RepID=A0AAD6X6V6_9AGAR|nr:hypothetical protein C8F04DRAFT_1392876 [Mycena alexandri]